MALRNGTALLRRIICSSQLPSNSEAFSKVDGRPVNTLLSSLGVQDQLLSLRSFLHTSQQAYKAGRSGQVRFTFIMLILAPVSDSTLRAMHGRW